MELWGGLKEMFSRKPEVLVGEVLLRTINGKRYYASVVADYDKKQCIAEIEFEYSNGYKTKERRYVFKEGDLNHAKKIY